MHSASSGTITSNHQGVVLGGDYEVMAVLRSGSINPKVLRVNLDARTCARSRQAKLYCQPRQPLETGSL